MINFEIRIFGEEILIFDSDTLKVKSRLYTGIGGVITLCITHSEDIGY